jgi:hypothetical protein
MKGELAVIKLQKIFYILTQVKPFQQHLQDTTGQSFMYRFVTFVSLAAFIARNKLKKLENQTKWAARKRLPGYSVLHTSACLDIVKTDTYNIV